MKRIKVPLPPVDEKKKVIEDVDKDRRFAIDAAIVRTMKSRKVLQHQQLVLEVVNQLSRMFKVGGGARGRVRALGVEGGDPRGRIGAAQRGTKGCDQGARGCLGRG
jgi:hypothetical protein